MTRIKKEGKVSLFTTIMYAMGDFPFSLQITLIGFFLMIFLTNTIGISAFWAGAIIFIGIVWDAITDPIVGYINDNTRSKVGRRRKYMFMFFLPMAITFMTLFSVPTLFRDGSEFIKVLVTLILYLLFTTFMTLVQTPFGAIINEITDDYDQRTKMTTFRMTGSILATLLAIIIPEFLGLANASQNNSMGYIWMGVIFGGLMVFFGYSSAFSLRERNRNLNQTKHAFNFKKYFIESWKSVPFRQVTIMYMLSIAIMNFIQGNLVYFINYKMLLPGIFLPIAGGVMILAVLFMPIWLIFAAKTSKRTAYITSIVIIVVALISLYFVPMFDYQSAGITAQLADPSMLLPQYQDLQVYYIPDVNLEMGQVIKVLWQQGPWVYFSIVLLSLGFSGLQMLPFSMVPDAINFSGSAREKKEGAYYGIVTFVQKMGWGIGMLLTGMVLHVSGYLEPAKVFTFESQTNALAGQIVLQSPTSVLAITILFSLIPALFGVMGIISIRKYKVDRDTLHAQIKEINKEEEGYDLEIVEVTNNLEIENFIRLHEILYEHDQLHVLPIRKEFRQMLKKQLIKHDYHESVIAYNVYVNKRISARIWLTVFTARPGLPTAKRQGAFNFFETVNDYQVVKTIFDKAQEWFTALGISYYYGNTNPLDPDDARGVLIEGFDSLPSVMCVYNLPYYGELLEQYGFKMDEDFYAYKLTLDDIPYARYDVIDKVKERNQFYVRSANKKNISKDALDVIQVFKDATPDDWDLRVPEPEKVHELLESWKNFLDFDLIKIAYTFEGRPIGFGMMVPNFNEALQKIHGKWNLFSIVKILYYKNKIKTTRAMIQMVVTDYQNKGVINAIYKDYFEVLKEKGVTFIDASTIGSDNYKSRYAIEKLGGTKYKVFRLYGIDVPKKDDVK